MGSLELNFQLILEYFRENGGKVKNRDAVRYFKRYLTDPALKDINRQRFKEYINTVAHTKQEGDEKVLLLKTKYLSYSSLDLQSSPLSTSTASLNSLSAQNDPRNNVGLPISPINTSYGSTTSLYTPTRQPPPYRNPPAVISPISPSPSLDSISLSSSSTMDDRPMAPPRQHRSNSRSNIHQDQVDKTPKNPLKSIENTEKGSLSVKERTQQFNRLASVEDELSPRMPKSAEKDRSKNWGADESDVANLIPLEPKKCQEWYVTASKGELQTLLRLAKDEPRLVNKKDPFSYTVLHWGAKHGNAELIKIFAGTYKVDVNSKTGYTPLHLSAQFDHRHIFKLLIEVYKADTKIRDYSGRTAAHYLVSKDQNEKNSVTLRKIKGRKKQSDKDLGFLRIGSLNVRVKKTTEAFSNFLGVGNSAAINPTESMGDKVHKGWGSADNVNKESMPAPKGYISRKKSKRPIDSGLSSTPTTPKTPVKNFSSSSLPNQANDSDSDTAAGFDSNWKN